MVTLHRGVMRRLVKDFSPPKLYDFVHQINQVARLVGFLVALCEVFDGRVHEVPQLLSGFLVVVQVFQELFCVILAFIVAIWLVEKLQSFYEDVQAVFQYFGLHYRVTEELFEDFDRSG